jgi:hypothetical protein
VLLLQLLLGSGNLAILPVAEANPVAAELGRFFAGMPEPLAAIDAAAVPELPIADLKKYCVAAELVQVDDFSHSRAELQALLLRHLAGDGNSDDMLEVHTCPADDPTCGAAAKTPEKKGEAGGAGLPEPPVGTGQTLVGERVPAAGAFQPTNAELAERVPDNPHVFTSNGIFKLVKKKADDMCVYSLEY